MSEAPETIWVGNWLSDLGEIAAWDIGEWRDEPWPTVDVVEYVRADRIEELEAKLERAVEALEGLIELHSLSTNEINPKSVLEFARSTLAELKGEK